MFTRGLSSVAEFRDLVSPAFFRLVAPGAVLKQAAALARNASRPGEVEVLRHEMARVLAPVVPGLRLEPDAAVQALSASSPPPSAHERGMQVLRLYFAQLRGAPRTFLDVRRARFEGPEDALVWRPGTLWVEWDPVFLDQVRGMYRGFYRDDRALLRRSLRGLGIEHSEDLLRTHFGAEGEHRFDLVAFQDVFHRMFERCIEHGTRLHPDFMPLGIGLSALHEHLSSLDVALDVRAAYLAGDARGADAA